MFHISERLGLARRHVARGRQIVERQQEIVRNSGLKTEETVQLLALSRKRRTSSRRIWTASCGKAPTIEIPFGAAFCTLRMSVGPSRGDGVEIARH